jgi:SPOR domain
MPYAPTPLPVALTPVPDAPTPVPNPAEVLRKQVYIAFGSIIAVGLTMTALYIGVRLFSNASVRNVAPTVAKAAPIVPKATPVVAKAVPHIVKAAPVVAKAPNVAAKAVPEVPKAAPVVVKAPPVVVAKAAPVVAKSVPDVPKAAPQIATALPAPRPEVKPDALPPTEHASAAALPKASVPVPKLITPQARERYLQLAALGPSYTERYLPQMRAQGYNVVVAPGPTDGIYRIVVGPFPDRPALERQKAVFEAAGIQTMERVY